MRLAMVSEHASPLAVLGGADAGGQNVHVAELSAALARAGHQVTVYTRWDDPALPRRVVAARGVTVEHVPAGPVAPVPKDELLPYMAAFGDYLADAWSVRTPDLVHAHFWMSGLAATAAARGTELPVVQTFHALGAVKQRHQGGHDTSPAGRVATEELLASGAHRTIATCSDERAELVRMGAAPDRIAIVPCGVDLRHFRPDGWQAPRDRRSRLVAVGRLVPRKGFGTAIAALPALPGVELVIAGGPGQARLADDPEAVRLRDLAARHGVADRVQLFGAVSRAEMPGLLRSADLVVATPWYEPFGIVPLEAMACGRPVVASAVGGFTDTIVDGVTGRLVPPRRPDLLAEVVRELLADPGERARLGTAGAARANARYGWRRIGAETERVYQQVLLDRHRPTADRVGLVR